MSDTNYEQLKLSLLRLDERYQEYLQYQADLPLFAVESMKESCIQRFETCFDTVWKHLKKYLEEDLGLPDLPNSPIPLFKTAHRSKVIEDVELWIEFNKMRIATSHDYNGVKADITFAIIPDFITEVKALYETMSGDVWQS